MSFIKRDNCNTIEEVILRNTGYKSLEELNGKPFYRFDKLQEAAEMIKDSIRKKELITVVGDYDADGITSSAIMYYTLSRLGANVKVRIPKRFTEGYGISNKIIEEIDSGLIVTVDNGIVAFEPVKLAKEKNLKVIITDHHLPSETGELPNADIIINPHIKGTADFEDYCGAGVAFRLIKHLTDDEAIIAKMSCFAAIGTVADVMPVIEENRQIINEGLNNMITRGCRTTGLYAILYRTELDRRVNAHDIGWTIGPVFNSISRLFDEGASQMLELICYDGEWNSEVQTKAEEFCKFNEIRKDKKTEGVEAIENRIKEDCLFGDNPLIVYEPSIGNGIIGLTASYLAEKYRVPAIVLTDSLEYPGYYQGSARSIPSVHIKELLDSCKEHIYRYGGHAGAAGLTIKPEEFQNFKQACQEKLATSTENLENIYYDLEIFASDVPKTIEAMKKYEPFGEGNPEIVFLVKDFQLSPKNSSTFMAQGAKKEHLKLFGKDSDAMCFGMVEKYHNLSDPQRLNIVGTLRLNYFRGIKSYQVEGKDFEESSVSFKKSLLEEKLEAMASKRYKECNSYEH